MRGLPQKFACVEVKDALVRRASISACDGLACGQAMLVGNAQQICIIRLLCSIEDNSHIHHNIDEKAFICHKGT